MILKTCRYEIQHFLYYLTILCLIEFLPHSSYASEMNEFINYQKNIFQVTMDFALDLALKKYDGRKVWIVYSIEGIPSLKVNQKRQAPGKNQTTLKQIILKNKIPEGINAASKEQEVSQNNVHFLPGKHNQLSTINQSDPGGKIQRSNADSELVIILDYSFESGNPCLYHIFWQKMDQPFLQENRPIFWLGDRFTEGSFHWLNSQFQQAKYIKLKQEIIAAIGAHNFSQEVTEFQRRIIFGNYLPILKDDAIERLGQHNSVESIKILTWLAVKAKDTHFRRKAIVALSQVKSRKAFDVIAALARKEKNSDVRHTAIFWLSQKEGEDSIDVLEEILKNEKDKSIKEYTLFAISQLPEGKSAPILSRIARTSPDPQIRKKAMFWLDQTKDQRMFNFFLDLANEDKPRGAN